MFQFLLEWYRGWRLGRAGRAEISDEECVSCGSKQLEVFAPGAYRCRSCGYEGGSGLAKMQEDARLARFDAMSPDERRESAREDLLEACQLLRSSIGYMDAAEKLGHLDLIGLSESDFVGEGEGGEKLSELFEGKKLFWEAQNHLKDAHYKLSKHPNGALHMEETIDYSGWTLDLHMDNLFSDFRSIQKIQRARDKAVEALESVEDALQRHFA